MLNENPAPLPSKIRLRKKAICLSSWLLSPWPMINREKKKKKWEVHFKSVNNYLYLKEVQEAGGEKDACAGNVGVSVSSRITAMDDHFWPSSTPALANWNDRDWMDCYVNPSFLARRKFDNNRRNKATEPAHSIPSRDAPQCSKIQTALIILN